MMCGRTSYFLYRRALLGGRDLLEGAQERWTRLRSRGANMEVEGIGLPHLFTNSCIDVKSS